MSDNTKPERPNETSATMLLAVRGIARNLFRAFPYRQISRLEWRTKRQHATTIIIAKHLVSDTSAAGQVRWRRLCGVFPRAGQLKLHPFKWALI